MILSSANLCVMRIIYAIFSTTAHALGNYRTLPSSFHIKTMLVSFKYKIIATWHIFIVRIIILNVTMK